MLGPVFLGVILVVGQVSPKPIPPGIPIPLPEGSSGIGFDDLQFSSRLGKLLVPGGRTGSLFLVDPKDGAISAIQGFSPASEYRGGHGEGITSVSENERRLFVTDRTSLALAVVDPAAGRIESRATLSASPDYVRFVGPTAEIWVTEPDADRIEIFRLASDPADRAPVHAADIAVPNGPESLVIDATRGRAYTHLWKGATLAIDLKSRRVVGRWNNECLDSRGIALDEKKGYVFAACADGRAVVLDAAHDGRILSSVKTRALGVDIIDYDRTLHHLYVPGGKNGMLAILTVGPAGELGEVGDTASPPGGHCVVSDQNGRAFVCDPKRGRLVAFTDPYPRAEWR
ncbi:MAG TPA: hypothetical protein VGH97_14400 [Thermoanaerobaculia bacterium]|jgi:hypothetical protein